MATDAARGTVTVRGDLGLFGCLCRTCCPVCSRRSCALLLVYSFIWRDLGLSGVCARHVLTCLTDLTASTDLLGSLALLRSLHIDTFCVLLLTTGTNKYLYRFVLGSAVARVDQVSVDW